MKNFLILVIIHQLYQCDDNKPKEPLNEMIQPLNKDEIKALLIKEFPIRESEKGAKLWERLPHKLKFTDNPSIRHINYIQSKMRYQLQQLPIINYQSEIDEKKILDQHRLFKKPIPLKIKQQPVITLILIVTLIILPILIINIFSIKQINTIINIKNNPMEYIVIMAIIMSIYFLIIHGMFLFISANNPYYKLFFFNNNFTTIFVEWICLMAITISWHHHEIILIPKLIIWFLVDCIIFYIIYNFQRYFLGNIIYMYEYEDPITFNEALMLFKYCKTRLDLNNEAEREQNNRNYLGKRNIAIALTDEEKRLIDILIDLNIK
jgi:hypothetical protein